VRLASAFGQCVWPVRLADWPSSFVLLEACSCEARIATEDKLS